MTSAIEQLDAVLHTWRLQHDALRVVLRTLQQRSRDSKSLGTLIKTHYEEKRRNQPGAKETFWLAKKQQRSLPY